MKPLPEEMLEMYQKMLRIREFEEIAGKLFLQNKIPGFLHSYIGQEAIAVGACTTLRKDDYITSTHRGHGHLIAKGASVDKMMAELLGKKTGYNKGKGGSMHIADFSLGVLGANGIVGGGIAIATGAGISIKRRREDKAVVCFFGEGAGNRGTFHESVNLASAWDLPVIYLMENNLYAVSTFQHKVQKTCDISARAAAYGIPSASVDGNDVLAVLKATVEFVARAREGRGPALLECKTYRVRGHYVGDPITYAPKEEVEEWKKRDPITMFRKVVVKEGILSEEKDLRMKEEVREEIQRAVRFAEQSPYPEGKEALEDVFD